HPELASEPRFATAEARRGHRDELDAALAAWTTTHDAHEAEALLQAGGIPASVVQTSRDLLDDPQLAHRRHFVRLDHPTHGATTLEGSRFRLSRTPAEIAGTAATFGRDNQYVLATILGYGEERIAALVAAGALA